MSKFIGRKEELNLLQDLRQKKSASLIVLKGRRRIGKSRLLEEFGHQFPTVFAFSGLPPEDRTTEQSQKEEFKGQLKRQIPSGISIQAEDWGDLFWQLANYAQQGPVL